MPEFGFDEWIDAQLRKVPLPPNLLTRLAESGPAGLADDALMDAELCRVEVPAHLESRLRRIARRGPPPLWRQVGLAASFFLMIGLLGIGYLGLLTGTFSPARDPLADKSAPTVEGGRTLERDDTARPDSATSLANRASTHRRAGPARPTPRGSQLASLPTAAASQAEDPEGNSPTKPIVQASTRAQTALGASGTLDRGPELETLDVPRVRGIVPPVIRGYDMLFQLKYGEHPFVTPAVDKSFLTTSLPFALATASFDMALGAVRSGRLPLPDEIRIEEFLAALDYPLPRAPASGLALHVAGSASPLGNGAAAAGRGSLHMLQVAVQAASFDVQAHSPNRLVVALDMSSQMRSGARIEAVRRALAKLADHMGDRDRVTLVRFAEQSNVLAEAATGAELKSLIASDDLAAPGGAANLVAAIESAADAVGGESLDPRQLVVITADRGNFDPTALPKATRQLGALAERNIPWQIIRVAADDNDAHWGQLASAARGKVAAARAPADIYTVLLEAMTGWQTKVASGASLKLTFNPQAVVGYRLLGHEATTLTGVSAEPLSIDLHADQTATGMYELSLKSGSVETVGSIELTWQDPHTDQPLRIVRPINRKQLAGKFSAAPPWYQAGVIAAKSAEVLRGSYYAPNTRPLAQVLDLAAQVDTRVAEQPDFQQLVNLLKKAEKLR